MSGHERAPGPNPEIDESGRRNQVDPTAAAARQAREEALQKRVGREALRGAGVEDPRARDVGETAVRGARRGDGPEIRKELSRLALDRTVEPPREDRSR